MKICFFVLLAALVAPSLRAEPKLEPPVVVRTFVPVYPDDLRREGVTGVVMISCVVDVHGNVTDLAVARTTNPAFNDAALEAMKKWKFKPAVLDGVPVARKVVIPLKFIVGET